MSFKFELFQSPLPIFKKSSDISASLREKTTEQPLQDNYEEVEMDIDSEPDSPGEQYRPSVISFMCQMGIVCMGLQKAQKS